MFEQLPCTRARNAAPLAFLFVLVPSEATTSGCFSPTDPCVVGGEVGKAYIAHLDETYDESVTDVKFFVGESRSGNSCMAFDGLTAGVGVVFIIGPTQAGSARCITHYADVNLPAVQAVGATPALNGQDVERDIAVFQQSVTAGGCAGSMEIDFRSRGNAFLAKSAGALPPFLVDRYFQTTEASACPAFGVPSGAFRCADTWVATLIPQ